MPDVRTDAGRGPDGANPAADVEMDSCDALSCEAQPHDTDSASVEGALKGLTLDHQADIIDRARSKFAINASKGLEFLIRHELLEDSPEEVASFLQHCNFLDRTQIGEYLCDEMNGRVLDCYLEAMSMEGMSVEAALRKVLLKFKLPGEAQKIDRLMEQFARHYHRCNPTVFSKGDTAYVLAFSMVLLNTDLHNPNNPHRMNKEAFIANSRGIDDGCDLPAGLLSEIYDAIAKSELTTESEGAFDYPLSASDIEGVLWKKSDRFASWNRRWCVVANGCLYYFYSRRDRSPRGVIPLEDLVVRPLDRRGKYRFEITAAVEEEEYVGDGEEVQLTSDSMYALSVDGNRSLYARSIDGGRSLYARSIGSGRDDRSLGGTVQSARSVRSLLLPPSQLFNAKPALPLIKSAKYVKGQLVEGKRDRYIFQCATEAERDQWVAVLSQRVKYRPIALESRPADSKVRAMSSPTAFSPITLTITDADAI